ncbi:hypothetical protein [Bacillus sp. JJ722]|uniref:hypothetical protein n=1 Tax=Bacillus sp. JJ722 TaxID=3122973 RepID=UPI002FFEC6EA
MYYFYNSPYTPYIQFQPNQVDYPFLQTYDSERPLPPSEPQSLKNSAENIKQLLSDVEIVNEKIRSLPTFAQEITSAAHKSDHQKLHYMINNSGIKNKATVSFSPGGISITYVHRESDCCYIVTFLNWREFF